MRRKMYGPALALPLALVALIGFVVAGAASADPLFARLLVVPDPTPTLLLGAGLAGLAFQGRPSYHRR